MTRWLGLAPRPLMASPRVKRSTRPFRIGNAAARKSVRSMGERVGASARPVRRRRGVSASGERSGGGMGCAPRVERVYRRVAAPHPPDGAPFTGRDVCDARRQAPSQARHLLARARVAGGTPRTDCLTFGQMRFGALPASLGELEAIAELWQGPRAALSRSSDPDPSLVQVLTGVRASESEFRTRVPGCGC